MPKVLRKERQNGPGSVRPRAPEAEPQGAGPEAPEAGDARLADFLFEAAALKRTPRTGYQFLGRGHENVAEHSFGTALLAWVLGRLSGRADPGRLMAMALLHDLAEARTGDLNYVNKRYVAPDEDRAFADAARGLPFSADLEDLWADWRQGTSLEARLAKDADQLDMILELRRLSCHGWRQASDWLFYAERRLATGEGRRLARAILARGPDDWWFERRDDLWVNPRCPAPGGARTEEAEPSPPKAAVPEAAEPGTARPGARPGRSPDVTRASPKDPAPKSGVPKGAASAPNSGSPKSGAPKGAAPAPKAGARKRAVPKGGSPKAGARKSAAPPAAPPKVAGR